MPPENESRRSLPLAGRREVEAARGERSSRRFASDKE
jgi:hypothetical protein